MNRKESKYPEDWFRIGQKDFKRAEILFDAGDFEGAGFHIQQTIEKYIKGFLLSKGWKLRKIHELEALLNDAIVYEPVLEKYRIDIQKITEFYIEDRYPFIVSSKLTVDDMKKSLATAFSVIKEIDKIMIQE